MDASFGSFNRWILAIVLISASLQQSDAENWPSGVRQPANPTIVVEGVNSSEVSLVWHSPANQAGDIIVQVHIQRGRPGSSKRETIALKLGGNAFKVESGFERDYRALLPLTLQLLNVDNTEEYIYFVSYSYQPGGTGSRIVDSQVRVIVNVPPRITKEPERNLRVNAGQKLTLICNASGDPVPNITWSKEGATTNQLVNATGYNLTLVNVQRKDVGSYKCTAENAYGTASSLAIVNLICSQCNTTTVAITIREGAVWRDSLRNRESLEFKMLASNLTSAIVAPYSRPGNEGKQLYEVAIKEFRPGSVIAIVQMQFPRGISDPLQPLRSAMNGGQLGIFKVDSELDLNPTSAPPTTPTGGSTSPKEPPSDPAARSGLSPEAMWGIIGACIAFALIVAIVILVCCICRKKKSTGGASKGKKYTEADGYRMNRQPPPSGLGTASPAYVEARMYAPTKKQDDQSNKPKYADLSFDQSSKPPPRYGTDTEYSDVSPSKRPPPPAGGGGGQGEGGFELWC